MSFVDSFIGAFQSLVRRSLQKHPYPHTAMPSSKRRLTLEQAADFLHLQPSDLRSLVVQGSLPAQPQGERLFFSQDDLDSWLAQHIIALQSLKKAARHRAAKTVRIPDTSRPFLDQLCLPEACVADLQAKSRPSALKALTELAADAGLIYDPVDLYDELLEREELASTTIEKGAAIPHPRHRFDTPLCDTSFLCVAKLATPIFYGPSPDGEKTDILFLVCCLDSNLHIQTIARLCLLCATTSLLPRLRLAQSPEDIHQTLLDIDQHPELFPADQPLPPTDSDDD